MPWSVPRAYPGYVVFTAPGAPDHRWGHRIVLDTPPGDLDDAFRLWRRHHGHRRVVRAWLAWEGPVEADMAGVDAWITGFLHEGPLPAGPRCALRLGPVVGAAAWRGLAEVAAAAWGYGDDQVALHHRQHDRRRGVPGLACWAAWDGARPVASVMLVHRGGWARFQEIWTDAAWRRRGLCSALMRRATAALPSDTRVVVTAEAGGAGEATYSALGFERVSRMALWSRPVPVRSAAPP